MMLKNYNINNITIQSYLQEFLSKDIIDNTYSVPKGWNGANYDKILEYSTDNKSLTDLLKNIPFTKYSFNKIFGETEAGTYFKNTVGKLLKPDRYYTSAYIPYGFVGWHCDDDVCGYYMMFSYSELGKGFFKARDPVTGYIHTDIDKAGWSLKVGKIGNEPEEKVWHCVASKCNRYTFILVFNEINDYNRALEIVDKY